MVAMNLDYPIQFLNSIIEKQQNPDNLLYQQDYSCMSSGVTKENLQVFLPLSIWLASIEVSKTSFLCLTDKLSKDLILDTND